MSRLSIGVILPSAQLDPSEIRACAGHAEDLGLDALFTGDHLVARTPTLDSTLTLATVAAVTTRLRVGFGVMIPALRHPVWAAKQIATLQHLTGNRVILGVGAGSQAHGTTAWDAVGVPYAERGRHTDAALDVLPTLISGKPTQLASGATITLAPAARTPPIWIGGGSPAALRRAARYGDGWFPSMITPEALAGGRSRLADLAAEHGRSMPQLAVGGSVLLGPAPPPAEALDGILAGLHQYGISPEVARHIPITGTPAQAAERFHQYAEAGAGHLILGVIGDDWRRQYELIAEAQAQTGQA